MLLASETVLGVDNAKSGVCYIYVCMDGTYAPLMFTGIFKVFTKSRLQYSECSILSNSVY